MGGMERERWISVRVEIKDGSGREEEEEEGGREEERVSGLWRRRREGRSEVGVEREERFGEGMIFGWGEEQREMGW